MARMKVLNGPSIRRMPIYLYWLSVMQARGDEFASTTQLAEYIDLEPINVRKDIALTGVTGTVGVGYRVGDLIAGIRRYLGWDVRGVAIPTVISRALAAVLILHFVVDEDYKLHIKRTLKHKFNFKILKKVLQVGIPYGVENGLFQLGRVLVLSLVSTFGTMAIAANSVGYAIGIFSVLPGFAINLGLTAVISRCVGANDYEQAKYYNKKCLVIVIISHIVINLLIFAGLPLILGIYNLSAQTAAMTTEMVIWHGIFAIIIWPISFTLPSTFRGAGDSKSVMYISLAVMFICRIGLSYVIADWMGIGVFGTWIAMLYNE